MTMTPEQLAENFKNQQSELIEEIKKLDSELTKKKELYIKLQGALEGLELLKSDSDPESESESVSEEDLVTTEVLS